MRMVTYKQGKSSSFIGLPWDLFVEEFRKSAFKSGEHWEVLRGDAVTRPSKRLSSWELLDLAKTEQNFKGRADSARARAKETETRGCL
jgi:hypothetical protein